MKTFSLLIVTLQLGFAVCASAGEPTTIETAQGKTYERCKIMKRDPDGVLFSHSKGVAKVLFSDLSEPMRNALGYDAFKADAYEKGQAEARKAAELAKRERETKMAEAMIAAQAKYAAQQPVVYVQQPNGGYMQSLAPVLGLGQMGAYYGGGYHGHGMYRNRGWSPSNSHIGAGSGGVYVPQGHGLNFYGFPNVSWSPTLGYTDLNNHLPVLFDQPHSGVVSGAGIPGSSTISGHH
jgi:hypothetical protein